MWRQDHPEFEEFLAVLRDPALADPIVQLGNVTAYRTRALAGGRAAAWRRSPPSWIRRAAAAA